MAANHFRHSHRVTYAECTIGNHIYYGRYLDLLEAARGEFFRSLGATFQHWQDQDAIFPVIECRLRYKAMAKYDDVLAIDIWPTAAEKVRLNFSSRITNQAGVLILEAETQHVCTSLDGKLQRLPAELIQLLQPHISAPPES
ncbi:MAG TPA: thioesterase family protein [Verrucomicrobiae bacterium]|jgi:acyl-CoA thioester hydrolase|nr:thioesterase family protein [Verrucomicrobiae bacterium]